VKAFLEMSFKYNNEDIYCTYAVYEEKSNQFCFMRRMIEEQLTLTKPASQATAGVLVPMDDCEIAYFTKC
jgi:hypothetical protein